MSLTLHYGQLTQGGVAMIVNAKECPAIGKGKQGIVLIVVLLVTHIWPKSLVCDIGFASRCLSLYAMRLSTPDIRGKINDHK